MFRILSNNMPCIFIGKYKVWLNKQWQSLDYDKFDDTTYIDLGFISIKRKQEGFNV